MQWFKRIEGIFWVYQESKRVSRDFKKIVGAGSYFPSGILGIPHRNHLNLTGKIDQNLDNWTSPSCYENFKQTIHQKQMGNEYRMGFYTFNYVQCFKTSILFYKKFWIVTGSHEENSTLHEGFQAIFRDYTCFLGISMNFRGFL